MSLETYKFTGPMTVHCSYRYIRFDAGTLPGRREVPISIRVDGRPGGQMMPGDYRQLSTLATILDIDCDPALTGWVTIGTDAPMSDRITGSVNSVDGGHLQTFEGNQYFGCISFSPAAGKYSVIAVENTSIRDLIVKSMIMYTGTSSTGYLFSGGASLVGTPIASTNMVNKTNLEDVRTDLKIFGFETLDGSSTSGLSFLPGATAIGSIAIGSGNKLFNSTPAILMAGQVLLLVHPAAAARFGIQIECEEII